MAEKTINSNKETPDIPPADFIHLHLHSQYSLLDGACRIKDVVKRAKSYGMPALAITDHGNLFGAMEFYHACKKEGIKPIIGSEMYVAPNSRFDTKAGPDDPVKERNYHLILLAKSEKGYKNLIKLSSLSYLEGFYYKPRIDWELLQKYNEDLICLTACMQGEVPRLLFLGEEQKAYQKAGMLSEIFGKGNFFLELQENGYDEQKIINRHLITLSKRMDLPLIATNDCHYLGKEDATTHDILLCVQTGKTVEDTNRLRFATQEFYFKSPDDMKRSFMDIPEALSNTLAVADKCNIELNYDNYQLPNYDVPEGYTLDSYLEELAWQGLRERYIEITPVLEQRLRYELDVIQKMGFPGYFLIVWDFIHYSRQHGIPVGPGRGSAAGSLVAYSLGITQIDPLKYGLIFERFLNPSRISMPDIDIDFCYVRRSEVIDYVTEKYGKDNVCQIITFGTMAAKNAIRDVGRAMKIPLPEVDKIAKMVPGTPGMTIHKALEESSDLKKEYDKNEQVRSLLDVARSVEGFPRHASTHAAGVVISPGPLTDYVPLYKPAGSDDVTTQFEMGTVADEIKLLKIDFLGLRTLTVVYDAAKLIKKRYGITLDLHNLPLDDPAVYELLTQAETDGVFQLESSGMRDLLRRLAPSNFEDISAVIALYRPGPLGSGMIDDFIKRRHGKIKLEFMHDSLSEILRNTYGVIVYQEQVMQIASTLSSFTMAEADKLRKAMGKKNPEVMAKMEAQFIEGAEKNSVDPKKAKEIWDLIVKFAGYGFNKSHTVAYALVAFQTAYIKAHYPVEFMASLLTSEMGNQDKMVNYIKSCRKMGLKVLPPDINESERSFTVINKETIRFGLGAVKNVGEAAIQLILDERNQSRFESLFNLCQRVDTGKVNSKVIESLIKCGAFDSMGTRRSQMLQVLPAALEQGSIYQKDQQQGQISFFDSFETAEDKKVVELSYPDIPEFTDHDLLKFEKELLGFYVSGHPLMQYEAVIEHYTDATAQDIYSRSEQYIGKTINLAGVIVDRKIKKTKKGTDMGIIQLEDFTGVADLRAFSGTLEEYGTVLQKDKLVQIEGKVDSYNDNVSITIQSAFPIEEAIERLTSSFHVKIPLLGGNEQLLKDIQKILHQHRGTLQTYLEFFKPGENEDQFIQIKTDFENSVAYDTVLVAEIEELSGKDTAWFSNKG